MKNLLFAVALLSLALASGCAKGGSGPCVSNCPAINVTDISNGIANVDQAPVGQSITFTATFTATPTVPVNWSISGTSCTGNPNPCGSFTATSASTATYQAPSTVPSDASIGIVATSSSDGSLSYTYSVTIVDISTDIAPASLSVGTGLTQQFTAVAVPDNAPQQFTWSCTANGNPCANFAQDPNISGLAYYTAQDNCSANCIQISAASIDPNGTNGSIKASLVASRLTNSTKPITFAFQFSGYDNNGNQVFAAGTFTASGSTISSGVEDEITWNGSQYAVTKNIAITGGSYAPTSSDTNNSNNAGTLTLVNGTSPNKFQVVLDGAGDIQMIEADGQGYGSGVVEPMAAGGGFNSGEQTFAFGFTGVDSGGHPVGYAGLMPINGSGTVGGGVIDVNDNGSSNNSVCSAATPPCNLAGTYTQDATYPSLWHVTLTSPISALFDLFVANGNTNATSPLTLFAISADTAPTTNPAVLGTMVLQDSKPIYNNAAFKGTSVSTLAGTTGGQNNVALTIGTTDGNGNFSGQFDQNNAGTLLKAVQFPGTSTTYTYAAASSNNGRYIFQMLGNSSAASPMPIILYASGENRGFLLDQSSPSVMTGTMTPQPNKVAGLFAASELPGTYALATNTNSDPSIASTGYLASNLLLTSPGGLVYNVTGTQNPGGQAVTGTYSLNLTSGAGAITLTAPTAKNYVIYMVDLTHFFMIDETSGVASSPIFFAQE